MLIPPKYKLTPRISQLLSQFEASKEVISSFNLPPEIERNIRRQSTLKSSLFSARIEGNPTTIDEYPKLSKKDIKKIEIQNVLRAINWIYEKESKKAITKKDLMTLHELTMKGLVSGKLGKFRTKHEGVFNTAGVIVYHAPPPSMLNNLIKKLLKYSNSNKEAFDPVKAVLAHYIFEKIHPFTDGSGRVGRLLILMILNKGGYGFKGILPFEEMIDKKRETYYKMLEESEKDLTEYVRFMLEILVEASNIAKKTVLSKNEFNKVDTLLPRRAEIYKIIKDQKLASFDMIKRRFIDVNSRTLRYDIKKLLDTGFINKLGNTKGVYYKISE